MARCKSNESVAGWTTQIWDDGNTIVLLDKGNARGPDGGIYMIESVANKSGRGRALWHITLRPPDDDTKYAPIASGPYPNLETAKVAYLVLAAALT